MSETTQNVLGQLAAVIARMRVLAQLVQSNERRPSADEIYRELVACGGALVAVQDLLSAPAPEPVASEDPPTESVRRTKRPATDPHNKKK